MYVENICRKMLYRVKMYTRKCIETNQQMCKVSSINNINKSCRWKKARVLGKMKGTRVTSVAWNATACSETNSG